MKIIKLNKNKINGYYNFMKKIKIIITIIFLFIIYMYTINITLIPKNLILCSGQNYYPKLLPGIHASETQETSNGNYNTSKIEYKLLGVNLLKNTSITRIEDIEVVPIGKIIGLKLYTDGVLVVGKSEIEDSNNNMTKPYEKSNIMEGDTIVSINEERVESIDTLKKIVNNSKGKDLRITLLRNGTTFTSNIKPVQSKNKDYKLGLWVKDAATGVGTMTFYEPNSQSFAVLGHGITDSDTDSLIQIDYGELVTSRVISIQKGKTESPGEIRGTILNQQKIGTVSKNTQFGLYGNLENLTSLNIDLSNKMKVASRDEIEVGKAKILCSIDSSNKAEEYDIEIEKLYTDNNYNNKSMLIRITDEELIQKTGGIIRGLSGAPIIQNGKFVGAITNVLVSNPEVGYGIFADLMIKEIGI